MDELDSYLKQLAEIAKQHPLGSKRRNIAVTRLLMVIEGSGRLYCKGRDDYPPEVYHETMQKLRAYVFRMIDRYDPTRAKMMTFINQKLNFLFKEAIQNNQRNQQQEASLSTLISTQKGNSDRTLEDTVVSENYVYLSDRLREMIEEDVENTFRSRCIRGRPEANFQAIALYMIEGYDRRGIAEMWGIPEQTVYAFFRRCCESFRPLFEKYLKE
jgi:DNA-directed RNA polymerase specialized sigma24 family protein